MRRRRQEPRSQDTALAARFDKRIFAMESDLAVDAQAPVKIEKIDTAPQQDVLAVVDRFRANLIRACAPAQERTRLKNLHRVPRAPESRRRRQARQPAA